jgi:hypothetical protein
MLNTKVFFIKEDINTVINHFDIPIIDYDNAILFSIIGDDYSKLFKLKTDISNGILTHRGNYYFFSHDTGNIPKGFALPKSVSSYIIRQITPDLFKRIIDNRGEYNYWETIFNNNYYYGVETTYTCKGKYEEVYKKKSHIRNGDLFIPYCHSPVGMKEGTTIGEWLINHSKKYSPSKMNINKIEFRSQILTELLSSYQPDESI